MRKLIICDTHYQIVIAIQLKLTLFKDCQCDIWISDHSADTYPVFQKMSKIELFDHVKYIRTRDFSYNLKGINKIVRIIKTDITKIVGEFSLYDEIVFYGLDFVILGLADYFRRKKYDVIWSRFEEGIFSYDTDKKYGKCVDVSIKLRKVLGLPSVFNDIKNFYCFFSTLKNDRYNWDIIEIPSIESNLNKIKSILTMLYPDAVYKIDSKYIYFASAADIEGQGYGELDLIFELCNKLEKENVVVKKHPRDNRSIYKDNGIRLLNTPNYPWEVFHIINDYKEKVLLTVTSGAFINVAAIDSRTFKGYFLLNNVKLDNAGIIKRKETIVTKINQLHSFGLADNICIGDLRDV